MTRSLLRSSFFNGDMEWAHGGNRRTAQIEELVKLAGLEVTNLEYCKEKNSLINLLNTLRVVIRNYGLPRTPRRLREYGSVYGSYTRTFDQHTGVKLLLWEANRAQLLISPYIAKDFDFKVIAVPHNLEAFVQPNKTNFKSKRFFRSLTLELESLSLADSIFCISREEQWFLKGYGIEANFLPYYPPKFILESLLEVRNSRKDQSFHHFLMLGTALNEPTFAGMIEQIQLLNTIAREFDFKVDLAGYGTEKLSMYCDDRVFNIHGAIDQDQLDLLLYRTKAVLAHQVFGTGALTRIPEMLIAGIPVIANSIACRSAFSYPGVYCYDNIVELKSLMLKYMGIPPMPERPLTLEHQFVECLKHLLSN